MPPKTSTAKKRKAPSRAAPAKRTLSASTRPAKRKRAKAAVTRRSIWNSTDDWDQLVADSQLSTSSVSRRRPRPRGLQSLVKCASEAAVRGFRRLWEEPIGPEWITEAERSRGGVWQDWWAVVPDYLKVGIRDAIFERWGGFMDAEIVSQVFTVPPTLFLPGDLLPVVASTGKLKPFWPADMDRITALVLTHAARADDTAISGTVYYLPNLETINLKRCALAGSKTVSTLIKRCPRLERINLKGTAVNEAGVRELLAAYGERLKVFKIDQTIIEDVNSTFTKRSFPSLTHLCLPGDLLNAPSKDALARIRRYGLSQPFPPPRPTPEDSVIQWPALSSSFPSLSHLYLPRLFLPDTTIGIRSNTLVKLSLVQGPPVPILSLARLVNEQTQSLRSVHFGYLSSKTTPAGIERVHFAELGEALAACKMEDFRLRCGESKDTLAVSLMRQLTPELLIGLQGSWRPSLKHLVIDTPATIEADTFISDAEDRECPALEVLHMPGATFRQTDAVFTALRAFKRLRNLNVSSTTVTDDDIFGLLDHCHLLSTIDLTSCRGIRVQNRRIVFKAWEEDRKKKEAAV